MDFLKANVTLNKQDIGKLIENEDIYIADVEFNQNLQVISIKILTQDDVGRLEYIPEKQEWQAIRNQKLIESETIKFEPKTSDEAIFYGNKTVLTGITADKIIPSEKRYAVKASDYISGINKGEGKVYIKNTDKEEELEKRIEVLERQVTQLEETLDDNNQYILALEDCLQDKVNNLSYENMLLNEEINLLKNSKESSCATKSMIDQLLSGVQSDINNIYSIVSKLETEKEDKVAVEYIANHIIPQISFIMRQELDKISDMLNLKADKSEYTNTTGNDYLSKLEDKLETRLTANKLKNNVLEDKLINQFYDENTEEEFNKHVEEISETAQKAGEITGESSDTLLKSLEKVLNQYSDIISVNRVEDDEE